MAIVSIILNFLNLYPAEKDIILLIRAFWGYMTPFIIFLGCYKAFSLGGLKMVNTAIGFIIGLIYFGFLLNLLGATEIIQFFVNRGIYEGADNIVADSARGLTSFFPEQSRISEQCGLLLVTLFILNFLDTKKFLLLLIATLLSAAGQMFVIFGELVIAFVVAMLLHVVFRKKFFEILLASILIFFISILIFFIFKYPESLISYIDILVDFGVPSRGIEAVKILLLYGTHGFAEDSGLIVKLSGVIASIASLASQPINFELGSTFNNEGLKYTIGETHFYIENLIFGNTEMVFFDFVYSAFGTVIIDFGILGAFIVFCFYILIFFQVNIANKSAERFSLNFGLIFLLFMSFIKIPLANPTLWFLAALIVFKASRKDVTEN